MSLDFERRTWNDALIDCLGRNDYEPGKVITPEDEKKVKDMTIKPPEAVKWEGNVYTYSF